MLVFGHHLTPGAEVLTRLGALVEGPGFLPHVSGLENLRLYWRSHRPAGRPTPTSSEALEIAGLGDAIHRKVRKYSHGMKQRLAIAQAMLGLPGAARARRAHRRPRPAADRRDAQGAARRTPPDGRAVLRLLAPARRGGADLHPRRGDAQGRGGRERPGRRRRRRLARSPTSTCPTSDAAEAVLDRLDGRPLGRPGRARGLVVDLDGMPRTDVVAALVNAGVGVDRVVPRRRLEDAFLALVGGDSKASGER